MVFLDSSYDVRRARAKLMDSDEVHSAPCADLYELLQPLQAARARARSRGAEEDTLRFERLDVLLPQRRGGLRGQIRLTGLVGLVEAEDVRDALVLYDAIDAAVPLGGLRCTEEHGDELGGGGHGGDAERVVPATQSGDSVPYITEGREVCIPSNLSRGEELAYVETGLRPGQARLLGTSNGWEAGEAGYECSGAEHGVTVDVLKGSKDDRGPYVTSQTVHLL